MPAELSARARELLADLPPFEQASYDIQGAVHVIANELERVEQAALLVRDNLYPNKADTYLRLWELLLSLSIEPPDKTLEQRRSSVLAFYAKISKAGTGIEWRELISEILGEGWTYEEYESDIGYEEYALNLDLAGYWRLGAVDGLIDQTGNGRDATGQGGITIGGVDGFTDDGAKATDFDGVNDYVTTGYGTRRNLIMNPSFEADANGAAPALWTPLTSDGGATPAFNASTAYFDADHRTGAKAALFSKTSAAGGVQSHFIAAASPGVDSVQPGLTYTFSCDLFMSVGAGSDWYLQVNWHKADNTVISVSQTSIFSASGYFVRRDGTAKSVTATAPPLASFAVCYVVTRTSSSGVQNAFYIDAAMFEQAASVGPYFDGSGYYPAVNSVPSEFVSDPGGHVGWLGTAHASASDKGCFANGTTRTFFGWANIDSLASARAIFASSAGSGVFARLMVLASGGVQWTANAGGEDDNPARAGAITTGTSHFYAVVFNEVANSLSLYLDGTFVATTTHNAQFLSGVGALQIGARGAGSNVMDGKMQGIGVAERALTADEISDLYQAATGALEDTFGPDPNTISITIPYAEDSFQSHEARRLLRDITPAHIELIFTTSDGFVLGHSELGDEL